MRLSIFPENHFLVLPATSQAPHAHGCNILCRVIILIGMLIKSTMVGRDLFVIAADRMTQEKVDQPHLRLTEGGAIKTMSHH